jgi:hypothetical protein
MRLVGQQLYIRELHLQALLNITRIAPLAHNIHVPTDEESGKADAQRGGRHVAPEAF